MVANKLVPSGDHERFALENASRVSSESCFDELCKVRIDLAVMSSTYTPFSLADSEATVKAILEPEGSIAGFKIPLSVMLSRVGAVGKSKASALETTSLSIFMVF